MSSRFDPQIIQKAMVSPRWSGLVRVEATVDEIAHWDPRLLRDNRVLVPIDVQAMYVPAGDTSLFVRMPWALTTRDELPPETMPEPFAEGQRREPGVYLHWAPPDALMRGTLQSVAGGSSNRLGMPALPDRWVVLRIIAPRDSETTVVKGWVLEADTAKAVPLELWPAASSTTKSSGKSVARDQLTGTVGGSVNWAGVYDAGVNRLSFYDSLSDLDAAAPGGVVENLAAYVVAGWWSDPRLDPLDVAETAASLSVRLSELGWFLVNDAEGGDKEAQDREINQARRETLGLKTGSRYGVISDAQRASTPSASEISAATSSAKVFAPQASRFADNARAVISTKPRWPRSTLLHGVVHGVPVRGPVVVDQRPRVDQVEIALGHHGDDVAAALATSGLGVMSPADRRAMERLLSAFTGQVLAELGTPDGLVGADEHEHNAGFRSLPGGQGPVERLRKGAETGPMNVGRAARSEQARVKATAKEKAGVDLRFVGSKRADLYRGKLADQRADMELFEGKPPVTETKTEVREVRRPLPRYFVPLEPMIAIRGAKRSLRHNADGRFSPDGKLHCRWPSQIPTTAKGLLDGANYVSSLPSGSLPQEVLLLARNAVVQDPYLVPWLAAAESKRRKLDQAATTRRLVAEAALRYGPNAIYDGTTEAFQQTSTDLRAAGESLSVVGTAQVADQLRRFSLFAGVDMNPVGVTAWSQPWIPLWLEWEVGIRASNRLDGWQLSQIDFDLSRPASLPTQTFSGRSPLNTGTARTLAAAIEEWLKAEEQRDRNNEGEVDEQTAAALQRIAASIGFLDVLAGTLDGLNHQLLGLPLDPFGMLAKRDGAALRPPAPVALPQLLIAGDLRLVRARIVDAFGRTLTLPVERVHVVTRDEAGVPPGLLLRPRLLRPARWMFRLVDPTLADVESSPAEAGSRAEATVDQIDPAQMINPVSGFLLPDHMDEALEVFDSGGQPLGQLMHEPFGGGVMWEIAPGRTGPADAGPGFALGERQRLLGLMTAGMVAADAQAREGKPAGPEDESALSAFLRAIDTTLWTVDTFAQMGSEHIAGLVGRPVAVVRATLLLEIDDDLDEVDLSDADQRAMREAAYRDLADRAFPFRLGELTRSDDGLLGFFVDDDYSHFHVVDKVVRDSAFDVRSGHGQFAQLGLTSQVPDIKPITHPYIVAEDELLLRPGQVLRLTLLMHPSSRVHLTSGILPRKNLQLARDWVHPGLSVMAPSLRVGPVLIDSDKVRLPKVSSFPKDQIWTRRSDPSTWKDDPILAATQTALLPDLPSEIQEGYIRVSPNPAPGSDS